MSLEEARCIKCDKLLALLKGELEIKCPRCGEMNKIRK
ncbi:Com family DNA-binding transcriptional regulator [Pseudogracilibacillus auburnensis]|nr:Com family DNA-binding transcriptional regulator [Pseudogracilibacillus auburnensis]